MTDTHFIRPGIELDWNGQRTVIQKVGAEVLLCNADGSHPVSVPAADIAGALRQATAPPALAHLHNIEDRLSETALLRLKRDSDLLHIMMTGRRSDQPDTDRPAADLDPALAPLGARRRRLAALLAEQQRTKGSRKGLTVLVKSEMRNLQRISERWENEQNLLDGRYRRPRAPRTSDPVMDALLTFLNAHALKSTKSSAALIRSFRIYCQKEQLDLTLPSDTTLKRRMQELRNGWMHLGASAKNRISELNVPLSPGTTRLATRPGELVLFDTTKANVWVKDPRTGRKLRLDVTIAIDLATRCIVGVAITYGTTKFAIGLCLADILRPKTAALASEWADQDEEPAGQPFIGRPDAFVSFYSAAFHPEGVIGDNGKQYVATHLTAQMARIGTHYEPQRTYTPTDKAQIERLFRTIKDMFEALMEGFTGGSVHEKGVNPRSEDLMTSTEYERRLRQCIDLYNHRTQEGLVLPEDPFMKLSPYVMYGILAARTGYIPDVDFRHEWIRFLPSDAVAMSPSRVRVQRLNFKSAALQRLQGDPDVLKTGKLRVYYDPADLRVAWCFDSEGNLHPLQWHHWTPNTPRFGIYHTNGVVEQFADKKLGNARAERILVDIFTGKYDDQDIEQIWGAEPLDPLLQASTAKLTATAPRPENPPPRNEENRSWSLLPAAPTPGSNGRPQGASDEEDAEGARREVAPASIPRRPRRALQPYQPNRSDP